MMMLETRTQVRLLGLPGSLRQGSYSLAVLRGLQPALSPAVDLQIGDLRLPLYDQDQDGPSTPQTVQAFRQAVAESDGLVIATPEYNHGIPGVLKNALDWASRPLGHSALTGKAVLVISVSPAFTGGVRAQAQANETLLAIQSRPVLGPQVVIGNVTNKIRDGRLTDEPSLRFALSAIDRLIALCPAVRRAEYADQSLG
ncbi:NADPH-dependent FMN reductase [Mesorhizobium ventifaucium]|uniref:NADPH-dependent FMN reductase n=1 Tax=Mesorhizobium ventifaucium TaxID=666020 RepID=A0ABM9E483_9HYPH|nr:NAD(P)H-dependent oxidoreductase [Mesorhizobium ventifaucium]CAH2403900.1 Putative NADPH-dependent FMN reductase [Mesorhizobium ventifaucium]